MYRKRERGLACLEPLTGRSDPVKPRFPDLEPVEGELQEVRNRFGLLVPPFRRYVTMELQLKPPVNVQRQNQLMNYLEAEYAKSTLRHRPYYIEPYCRGPPDRAMRLLVGFRTATRPAWTRMKPQLKEGRRDISLQMQQMQEAIKESRERREDQRQKDAKMWGQGTEEGLLEGFKSELGGPKVPAVSPHLYQPRVAKTKSELTKNQEIANALSRKNNIQAESVRRLEKQQQHGDDVRSNREQEAAQKIGRHVSRIREKDEKFEQFLKSKLKY